MTEEFKIGDTVRISKIVTDLDGNELSKTLGKTGKIICIDKNFRFPYLVKFSFEYSNNNHEWFKKDELELKNEILDLIERTIK